MTKIYTVKSNARRDAKKRGLNPDVVVACPGGFMIREPRATRSLGEGKSVALRSMLLAGWQTVDRLCSSLDWQPHTVRGAISTLAKTGSLSIERKRENGATSYRAVAVSVAAAAE